jgi:hypothetical protein
MNMSNVKGEFFDVIEGAAETSGARQLIGHQASTLLKYIKPINNL